MRRYEELVVLLRKTFTYDELVKMFVEREDHSFIDIGQLANFRLPDAQAAWLGFEITVDNKYLNSRYRVVTNKTVRRVTSTIP